MCLSLLLVQCCAYLGPDALAKSLVLFPASLPYVLSHGLDWHPLPEDDPLSQVGMLRNLQHNELSNDPVHKSVLGG